MRLLERITFIACASLITLVLVWLCYDASKRVYADYLFSNASYEPSFMKAEKMMVKALRILPNNSFYEDTAGTVYYNVLAVTGDNRAYDNASILLYRSYMHNPYDPQPLVHLVQLDILAVKIGLLQKPSDRGLWACDAVTNLDKNNTTIRNLAEELRRMK